MSEDHRRHIRSFVKRDSRVTKAQAEALNAYLEKYRFGDADLSFNSFDNLNLEIGAGDGQCTLALATALPDSGFVAAEVYRAGLGRLLQAVNERQLNNVRVSDTDVIELLSVVPSDYFDSAMIFFPDPWPKKKHHKRRLLKVAFLDQLAIKLKMSALLFIATDIEDYALQILEAIVASNQWINLAGNDRWGIRPLFRPRTKFEAKGIREGRSVFEIVACKNPLGAEN